MKGMSARTVLLGLVVLSLARPVWAAEEQAKSAYPGPFDRLGWNVADSFTGLNLGFQLAGIAATATLSTQDTDVRLHRYFRDHPDWGKAAYPAIVLGATGPVLLFAGLQIAGRATQNRETVGAAYAVVQSAAVTLAYVTVLKLFTGRPAPSDANLPALAEDDAHLSRSFRPGFYRGGVVSGWPSGHVAVTTATLTALAFYYPDAWWLKAVAFVGTAGMMLGVSSFERGGMHWASDALAGALMAFPIGMSTGRGMRAVVGGKKAVPTAWFVTPSLRPEAPGAMVGRFF